MQLRYGRVERFPHLRMWLIALMFLTAGVLIRVAFRDVIKPIPRTPRIDVRTSVAIGDSTSTIQAKQQASLRFQWTNIGIAVASLFGIAFAEFVATFLDPRYGVAIHVALLALFLFLGAALSDEYRCRFFQAISIAPMIRIVSLGMPLSDLPQLFWYPVTAIPLFVGTYLIICNLHLSRNSLNLRLPKLRHLPVEMAVWASGAGLGVIEWRILGAKPIVSDTLGWIIGGGLILVVSTGFLEELIFRGLIQRIAGDLIGSISGLILTAALFCAMHTGYKSALDLVFVFMVALYFGLVVRYTKSLFGVTMAHGTINTMLFIVLPLAFS